MKKSKAEEVGLRPELVESAKAFIRVLLSDGPKRPSDFDMALIGHVDLFIALNGRASLSPFSFGLSELMEEGEVRHWQDIGGDQWYEHHDFIEVEVKA